MNAPVNAADLAADRDLAQDLIRQRYRRDDLAPPVAWNEALEVILSHRSVRAFLRQPLAEGTLETLVAAAQSKSRPARRGSRPLRETRSTSRRRRSFWCG